MKEVNYTAGRTSKVNLDYGGGFMAEKLEMRRAGLLTTAAGGTRTAIKLDRPWQNNIVVNPATCPFCTKQQDEITEFSNENWRVLSNIFTPFDYHLLIIPRTCWPKEELRTLGGREKIRAMLKIALNISNKEDRNLLLSAHIGSLAGQNVMHLHWHLLQPLRSSEAEDYIGSTLFDMPTNDSALIFETDSYRVVAGGHRAGQCFFLPTADSDNPDKLAEVIDYTVKLYAERFKSNQGLPPDYMVGIRINQPLGDIGSNIEYGFYLPILNHWGGTEYLALLEGTPLILPWPHEKTVEHLKS